MNTKKAKIILRGKTISIDRDQSILILFTIWDFILFTRLVESMRYVQISGDALTLLADQIDELEQIQIIFDSLKNNIVTNQFSNINLSRRDLIFIHLTFFTMSNQFDFIRDNFYKYKNYKDGYSIEFEELVYEQQNEELITQ